MPDILWATSSSLSHSLPISAQRLVNGYAEAEPPDAKTPVAVFGSPGISIFANVGVGPIRGAICFKGVAYVVAGTGFYSVDADGGATLLSGVTLIAGSTDLVSIAGSTAGDIVIATGVKGYNYNTGSSTFAEITDPDFIDTARTVCFIGGYFVLDNPGTNEFFLSNLLDGTSYSALDFASAESSPDRVLAVVENQGILYIFGETTIEPWQQTGALSFPFQPYHGSTPARGIATPLAFAKEDNSIFFLGNDKVFYRLAGIQPTRVSGHSQENQWESYGVIDDAFCFTWSHDGHKFVVLTLAGHTWEYDIATNLWHERTSWDPTGTEVRWRMNCAINAYGKTLLGDANSGKFGAVDHDVYTEFNDPVRMIMVAPPIHGGDKAIFMPHFQLEVETGVGLVEGQGSDPQYMLDYSDDGGFNWSSPQVWRSAGAIGERRRRLNWRQLGRSQVSRTLRVQITDPVKRVVIKARCPGLYTGL